MPEPVLTGLAVLEKTSGVPRREGTAQLAEGRIRKSREDIEAESRPEDRVGCEQPPGDRGELGKPGGGHHAHRVRHRSADGRRVRAAVGEQPRQLGDEKRLSPLRSAIVRTRSGGGALPMVSVATTVMSSMPNGWSATTVPDRISALRTLSRPFQA